MRGVMEMHDGNDMAMRVADDDSHPMLHSQMMPMMMMDHIVMSRVRMRIRQRMGRMKRDAALCQGRRRTCVMWQAHHAMHV